MYTSNFFFFFNIEVALNLIVRENFKHFEIYNYYCKNIMHTILTLTFLQKKKKSDGNIPFVYLFLDNIFNIHASLIYIAFSTANFVCSSNVYI